jgi:hypothetical protein
VLANADTSTANATNTNIKKTIQIANITAYRAYPQAQKQLMKIGKKFTKIIFLNQRSMNIW